MEITLKRQLQRSGTLGNSRRTGPTTRELRGDFDPATLLATKPRTERR